MQHVSAAVREKEKRTFLRKSPLKKEIVRLIGLEPTRIATPDPKSGASTNFATSAKDVAKLVQGERKTKFLFEFFRAAA